MDESEKDKKAHQEELESGEFELEERPGGKFRLTTKGKLGGRRFERESVEATNNPDESIRITLERMAKKPPPTPPKSPGGK